MALFQRWRQMQPVSEPVSEPVGPDPYAEMTIAEIKRSVIRGRVTAMRPHATYEEIALTLGVSKKTLWDYRKQMGMV
jgi:hypothetical protein